jgi:hypothetical protein
LASPPRPCIAGLNSDLDFLATAPTSQRVLSASPEEQPELAKVVNLLAHLDTAGERMPRLRFVQARRFLAASGEACTRSVPVAA